jgi:hypothetical protein
MLNSGRATPKILAWLREKGLLPMAGLFSNCLSRRVPLPVAVVAGCNDVMCLDAALSMVCDSPDATGTTALQLAVSRKQSRYAKLLARRALQRRAQAATPEACVDYLLSGVRRDNKEATDRRRAVLAFQAQSVWYTPAALRSACAAVVSGSNTVCTVCRESQNVGVHLPCGHAVSCSTCHAEWASVCAARQSSATCPVCRKEVELFLVPNSRTT